MRRQWVSVPPLHHSLSNIHAHDHLGIRPNAIADLLPHLRYLWIRPRICNDTYALTFVRSYRTQTPPNFRPEGIFLPRKPLQLELRAPRTITVLDISTTAINRYFPFKTHFRRTYAIRIRVPQIRVCVRGDARTVHYAFLLKLGLPLKHKKSPFFTFSSNPVSIRDKHWLKVSLHVALCNWKLLVDIFIVLGLMFNAQSTQKS